MGTDEVIRKTLALAQSQLSNYKMMDSYRANAIGNQNSELHSNSSRTSQPSSLTVDNPPIASKG
ncbi:hypothetical protein OYT1_ch2441 [Ferriphaselus amnicola]|uniref:Uncharacterized protein n=1 Tax=Ferriphaselus amnicola TaxID=1188319 RepID=A0A2Z6GFE5_9PROT|nr:hypothetical protein OYT1_ch2441 [Ferriphaselus amnicola]